MEEVFFSDEVEVAEEAHPPSSEEAQKDAHACPVNPKPATGIELF